MIVCRRLCGWDRAEMQDNATLAEQAAVPAPEATPHGQMRRRRDVDLKFWLGPLKLWSVSFTVEIEPWRPYPLDQPVPAPPDLAGLPLDVDGLYRPSQRIDAEEPDFRLQDRALRYIESRFHRRFIDLTTGFDAYMSKFSGKTRSTFRRKIRKFREASLGNIDWRCYRSVSEMREFYDQARGISRRTYQEKLFDAGLPEGGSFVSGMLARADAGSIRGFLLFLAGEPVSYLYLPVSDDRVIYGHLGFDPAYASLSPGTVLQLHALESLFAEGTLRVFDFTEGEGEHKRLFATHECLCGNVFYLRPTAKNRAVVQLHLAARRVAGFADRELARHSLKTRLKQYLRGQRPGLRKELRE